MPILHVIMHQEEWDIASRNQKLGNWLQGDDCYVEVDVLRNRTSTASPLKIHQDLLQGSVIGKDKAWFC